MENPFPLLTAALLDALMKAGHQYFTRQTYLRGEKDANGARSRGLLICHYTEKSKAEIHYQALKEDKSRYLYDITQEDHLRRLRIAAAQPAGYKVFSPFLLKPWVPSPALAVKIRAYIAKNLEWSPVKKDAVKCNLFLQFGVLFITLKWKTNEVKLPLSVIEED